jgi:Na+-translocating ferredoxin:NAD+ oxidoreductase RNF subunit RnfB
MDKTVMTCPRCGYPGPDPRAQEAGRKGGAARVPKGFAVARVLRKALATRRENARRLLDGGTVEGPK